MRFSLKTGITTLAISLIQVISANAYYDNSYPSEYLYQHDSCDNSCRDFEFYADFLWLRADEDGIPIGGVFNGGTANVTNSERTDNIGQGVGGGVTTDIKEFDFRWMPAQRLGVAYNLPCDCFDIGAYWTYLHTHAKKHFSTGTDEFGSAWSISAFSDVDVHAKWQLNLDVLDIELGRSFCVTQCLSLRPFVGIRAAWVDQKIHITTNDSTDGTLDEETHLKSRYNGVGLRGGLESEWGLGCGFSLYGSAAASVLYGDFRNHYENDDPVTENANVPDGKITVNFSSQHDRIRACRAIVDAGLGVRWRQFWCCDLIALTLDIGWEHHQFFHQNRFESPNNSDQNYISGNGDLCVQGLTISARLDF